MSKYLVQALEQIADPLKWMQRDLQSPNRLDGAMAIYRANNPEYFKRIARNALAEHRAHQDEEPLHPAAEVCAQVYQVVGVLLGDLGLFDTDRGQNVLTNLSRAEVVHEVLPWESVAVEAAALARVRVDNKLQELIRHGTTLSNVVFVATKPGAVLTEQQCSFLHEARAGWDEALREYRAALADQEEQCKIETGNNGVSNVPTRAEIAISETGSGSADKLVLTRKSAPSDVTEEKDIYDPTIATPDERACLYCAKGDHLTTECWSTQGLNTKGERELARIVRLAAMVENQTSFNDHLVKAMTNDAIGIHALIRGVQSLRNRSDVNQLEVETIHQLWTGLLIKQMMNPQDLDHPYAIKSIRVLLVPHAATVDEFVNTWKRSENLMFFDGLNRHIHPIEVASSLIGVRFNIRGTAFHYGFSHSDVLDFVTYSIEQGDQNYVMICPSNLPVKDLLEQVRGYPLSRYIKAS